MSDRETLASKVALALIVAALSFAGSALGSVISSRYEASKWERETNYSSRKSIIEKRLDLLDRTVRIFNKADAAQFLQLHGESLLQLNKADLEYAISKHRPGNDAEFRNSLDRLLADRLQLSDMNVELGSVLTLDALYFGSRTRDMIGAIKQKEANGKWWELDGKSRTDLFDAMYQEMSVGFDGK